MFSRTTRSKDFRRWVLDVLEGVEAPANDGRALPTPEPGLPKAVRHAINRKAQLLSLRHYDRLRDDLTKAVERHRARYPGAPGLVAYVEKVATPDSHLVVIHRDSLRRITNRVSCMALLQQQAMEDIQALEAETGRQWYGR